MRRYLLTLTLLAPLALGSACDWRKFDDLQERTPVLAVGPTDSFGPTDDFGRYVLPLSGPAAGATGGRFVVSAASTGSLAVVEIDAKGNVTTRNKSDGIFDGEEITALAEVPGGKQVLLGAHQAGEHQLGGAFVLTIGEGLSVAVLAEPEDDFEFGLGVGAGALAGDAATADFVVLSIDRLTVFVDGDPAKAVAATPSAIDCPLDVTAAPKEARTNRPVVVAALKGPGAPQIVVGTPTAGGQGAVSVFDVDPTTGVATCAFAYRSPTARFGQALATGDFNDDGKLDLLVGAPPEGAFWIAGPLTAASPILPVALAKGGAGTELGFAVGAGNVDGMPGDEALVGDPEAVVAGKVQAGEVRVVGGKTLGAEQPVVRRLNPDATDGFGFQVGAMPFCSSACGTAGAVTQDLLSAGARTRVSTFFVLEAGAKDPRTP